MSSESETIVRYIDRQPKVDPVQLQRGMRALPQVLAGMGYASLRPGQDKVVSALMAGRDAVVVLPTATGKTACFVIPTLALKWGTLVFVPLISLMRDHVRNMQSRGVRAAAINSADPSMSAEHLRMWCRGELDVLIVAPERLWREDFISAMRHRKPNLVAVDEAHCFPGDYMVATEFGNRTLRDLHLSFQAGHQLPRLWTRNTAGFLELKRVTNTWEHAATNKRMVRVALRGKGAADCTDDHVWFCGDKEVAAKDLAPGDLVSCKAFGGQELRGLNPDQLQVVIGSYLGDGGFGCTGGATNSYRAEWTHGKEQEAYCVWKATLLGGETTPLDKNGFSGKPAIRGRSAVFQLPGRIGAGGRWAKKALIPSWMLAKMDARALAIWFMDDGSFNSGGLMLHTQGFAKVGVEALQDMLLTKFGIQTKVSYAKGWVLRMSVESGKAFAHIVRPYMRPEFMYKLGLTAGDASWPPYVWASQFSTALYPVQRVTYLERAPKHVYDIEVEDNHNFFVFTKVSGTSRTVLSYDTNHAVLVHNCLSAWSHNFRSAYCIIGDFITQHNPDVVAAFTATCPPEVEADIRRVLCIQKAMPIVYYPRRKNLDLRASDSPGVHGLARDIQENYPKGSTVIYCATTKKTEDVAQELGAFMGEEVGFYHGKLAPSQRTYQQDAFMNGSCQIMCATNAFGMGVDKPDVRAVYHWDIPGTVEEWAQEMGRAGRDGNHSICHTFFSQTGVRDRKFLLGLSNPEPSEILAVFEAARKNVNAEGIIKLDADGLGKAAGLRVMARFGAIAQFLIGSQVFQREARTEKMAGVRFLNHIDDHHFRTLRDACHNISEPTADPTLINVDIIQLAAHLDISEAAVRSKFKRFAQDHLLEWIPPGRAQPIRLIGGRDRINLDFAQELLDRAYNKLNRVIYGCTQVADRDRHAFLEAEFGIKSV